MTLIWITQRLCYHMSSLSLKGALNPEKDARFYERKTLLKSSIIKTQPNQAPLVRNNVYSSSPFPPSGQPYLTHPACISRFSSSLCSYSTFYTHTLQLLTINSPFNLLTSLVGVFLEKLPRYHSCSQSWIHLRFSNSII